VAILIDGHLDLADNALRKGRDLTLELGALRAAEQRTVQEAMVTLPELRLGRIDIVFATLFVMPRHAADNPFGTYESPGEARGLAVRQLELYQRWEEEGRIRLLRSRSELESFLTVPSAEERPTGVVLLMEGAEPLRNPEDLGWWREQGVRIVGPAWKATRYAGGTGAPGPLTAMGIELIDAIRHHELILDVSHLAEESFWQALELGPEKVIASHSNARRFVESARHLSDEMIRAVGARKGTVGLVLANKFLKLGVEEGEPKESVAMADVRRHAEHVAGLIGWSGVAIGSDFDGGFGLQETPLELTRGADFSRLDCVAPVAHAAGVLGENLLRLLRESLGTR
jgi:membrane dipeptidase